MGFSSLIVNHVHLCHYFRQFQIEGVLFFRLSYCYLLNVEVALCRDGGEISTRDLQKMVQALPQYTEQVEKITLHVEVCFSCSRRLCCFHFEN